MENYDNDNNQNRYDTEQELINTARDGSAAGFLICKPEMTDIGEFTENENDLKAMKRYSS